ncbi:peroxiredoxin [Sphingomonas sp. SUN039]|uniref:peroxiredoxin n=1 Tax=Sphingomonas sp. SUN039 TaxID=2937787 RepID=UPI0021642881|nr:peroxiredoxin [Sphingomonas sp. SUN039]UVO54893.1 peroxiredoxin [Sphingomonas sp. SUN039]
MIRTALAATVLALSTPALAALPVGAPAPDFTTQGALAGKPFAFQLSKALKKGPVVLYFFPAVFTQGCTIETKAFADAHDQFTKAGAQVIGVSAGAVDKLTEFSVEACRNKFAVAVASPKMIADYDVVLPMRATLSNRTSFVIGKNGKVAFVHSEMKPEGHITGTLAAVQALGGKRGAK